MLTLIIGPEVGHGDQGGQHHTGHQAKPQDPPEGTGWLDVVTLVIVVNVLLSSCKAG